MPTRQPALTRRAVLGGTLGVVVVGAAGCSLDALDPTRDDPTYTPSSGPSSGVSDRPTPTTPAEEPDAVDDSGLVEEVLAALALAHRTARANARLHPETAAALRPFEALHQVHGEELGGLPRTTGRVSSPDDSPDEVLARVARSEARLQRTLVGAAGAAGSGALAQTFASMAGAVAQRRASLP